MNLGTEDEAMIRNLYEKKRESKDLHLMAGRLCTPDNSLQIAILEECC